jgi:glycosyltransferase involved in cell wall biosynthesis
VFVLTSLWEGLPISVLEAMASSLPVVATDTIGIREVILEGKTGFLVSPRDMNKMSEKLSVLLKDKGLRVRMGENARQGLGGDFYLKNMARNTQDLYDSLIKNGGGLYAN